MDLNGALEAGQIGFIFGSHFAKDIHIHCPIDLAHVDHVALLGNGRGVCAFGGSIVIADKTEDLVDIGFFDFTHAHLEAGAEFFKNTEHRAATCAALR